MTAEAMTMPMSEIEDWMKGMAKSMPTMPLSPLMSHPTAAAAAATALGFGAAGQMMGLMMGSMQGALEASRKLGMPVTPVDFEAGLRFWDGEWVVAAGKAARDETEQTVARTIDAAKDVSADMRSDAEDAGTAVKSALKEAAEVVATVSAAATAPVRKTVTKAAEPVKRTPEPAAKSSSVVSAPSAPRKMARPESPDDLKQISGIGPKLEEVLNRIGVWSFEQVAGWSEAEIAWVEDYLQFKGRIDRDGWLDQAKALSKK
ncbi:hypothetical protein [Pararhizobium haloflavum]|uniref:hypothetical protein n=1 Tax=Pararhizobium haloflavum TaxID=2037914 RepID=UPI0012FFFD39|nr:hypothetical protein [Pararhizobium haloflavum]